MGAIVGALLLAAVATGNVAAADGEMRALPYPFNRLVTFASDSDYEISWHGASIHHYLNETLGLPISDSMWVSNAAGNPSYSALFRSTTELAHQASGVAAHSVFGLLVREWHRGNIDHFHSWTDDLILQYRYLLPIPAALSPEPTAIDVLKADFISDFQAVARPGSRPYRQMRLLFEGDIPADLSVAVAFDDGTSETFPPGLVAKFQSAAVPERSLPATVTLFLAEPMPLGPLLKRTDAPAFVTQVTLTAPSCQQSCNAKLLGFERDSFSRFLVEAQLPTVEYLNIRPSLLTSHGGNSYNPSFTGTGDPYRLELHLAGEGAELYQGNLVGLAGVEGSHAYHADYLARLGVRNVTSVINGDPSERSAWDALTPDPAPIYKKFYTTAKSSVSFGLISDSIESAVAALVEREPVISGIDLSPFLCTVHVYCRDASQGSVSGALIRLGQSLAAKGVPFEHNWYTHLGTAKFDPQFTATLTQPFPAATMEAFRELALSYHGAASTEFRPWVPPAGVWANYRLMRAKLADLIDVDEATSSVAISSYFDAVLQTRLPDPSVGTRDLHGITVYVPHAETASVAVDGKSIDWFTRNPADETGRESVTIIDDSAPTVVFDRLDPAYGGATDCTGCEASWIGDGAVPGADSDFDQYLQLTATGPDAQFDYVPRDLAVWNATHIGVRYRIRRMDNIAPTGTLRLTFVTHTGAHVTLAEGTVFGLPPQGADVGAWLPAAGQDWTTYTQSQADFVWGPGATQHAVLPLAFGKVVKVEAGLSGATTGDILEIADLRFFRPTSNGAAPDGLLLAGGQVLAENGVPLADALVRLVLSDKRELTTATDQSGYYFFHAVPRGDVVSIDAQSGEMSCSPSRGERIEIWKNEAELDVDLGDC